MPLVFIAGSTLPNIFLKNNVKIHQFFDEHVHLFLGLSEFERYFSI
jgi:hypothetical protein